MSSSAGATAAIIAAQQQKQRQMEEEEMTSYSANDLEGWEFKIVRTGMKSFKDLHRLNSFLEEESKAGWELVEKFDNHRIRLKRKVTAKRNDRNLTIDPYRVTMGDSESVIVVIFLVAMFSIIIFSIVMSSI
ncbi:MAG: hypothetical protein HOA24_00695 [Candidatus Pacebacteria bacterium]|jgi:hypothetical protein|nr:hypothetical protein [Candidatus Paceibacterota bacterium]MBT4005035.1 hypothetical protein [Candidatus Paceibacterota bacterium]MBT6898507.1 hypothetical protein [Candidatus Paceibacterota bacterium]